MKSSFAAVLIAVVYVADAANNFRAVTDSSLKTDQEIKLEFKAPDDLAPRPLYRSPVEQLVLAREASKLAAYGPNYPVLQALRVDYQALKAGVANGTTDFGAADIEYGRIFQALSDFNERNEEHISFRFEFPPLY